MSQGESKAENAACLRVAGSPFLGNLSFAKPQTACDMSRTSPSKNQATSLHAIAVYLATMPLDPDEPRLISQSGQS